MITLTSLLTFLILRGFQTCGLICTIYLKLILLIVNYLTLILKVNVY